MKKIFLALILAAFAVIASCTSTQVHRDATCGDLHPVPYKDMIICVTPDVYKVDGVRMPVGLSEAYRIADEADMRLPTPAMVRAMWEAADIKARPIPMTPDHTMTTLPVFIEHDRLINQQIAKEHPGKTGLIMGIKKALVVPGDPSNVAIYGWFYPNGTRIQPYNNRDHGREYRDYSHGLYLVTKYGIRDGVRVNLE